ncbi:MAG: DNA polymerase IV [Pseudomonadota bacterium]
MTTLCRDCGQITPAHAEGHVLAACPSCGSHRLVAHPELLALDIAHVDCDAFYASVEKRDDPSLQDKPLIVGHPGGRGVVTTACYIARQYGPRSAMPMFKAMALCPHAVIVKPDMAKYKRVSQQIRAIFNDATQIIEPVSLDEAYLDLSGLRALDGVPADALATVAYRVRSEVGITVSIGLSYNKFLAKLASDLDKPDGFSVIGRGEAKAFLAPLPVEKINGVGAATAARMHARGLTTIGQLQRLSDMELAALFGRFGRRLAGYVHGNDNRMVSPERATKSVSAETTFSSDLASADDLIARAAGLCERVAERLARSELAGTTVTVKLKTHDFRIMTRNRQLIAPTQRADVLLETAAHLIRENADGTPFRLVGVGVSEIVDAEAADPPDLFRDAEGASTTALLPRDNAETR